MLLLKGVDVAYKYFNKEQYEAGGYGYLASMTFNNNVSLSGVELASADFRFVVKDLNNKDSSGWTMTSDNTGIFMTNGNTALITRAGSVNVTLTKGKYSFSCKVTFTRKGGAVYSWSIAKPSNYQELLKEYGLYLQNGG